MRACSLFLSLLIALGVVAAADVDLIPLVPSTIVLVIIGIALSYMASDALADPQLKAWAKGELVELITGVILIVSISMLFIGTTELSKTITGKDDYTQIAIDVIDGMLEDYGVAYESIIKAAARIRIGATFSTWLTIPVWFFSFNYSSAPLTGIGPIFISLGMATQGLTNVIFLYEGIRLLLLFCQATIPEIVLPLAFILRLIPFTRRAGNTLIAVALGGILLLPLSVIIIGYMNSLIDYPQPALSNDELRRLDAYPWPVIAMSAFCQMPANRFILTLNEYGFAALVCLPAAIIPAAYAACYTAVSQVVYHVIQTALHGVQAIITGIWLAWADWAAAASGSAGSIWAREVWHILRPFLENVSNLVLVGYVNAIIIAIITTSGIRSISTALGGEWQLPGIERLI
ncbi:MAG: hypothetical protein QXT45_05155 [Candidatus Bilamarchaeaceae archaeon]